MKRKYLLIAVLLTLFLVVAVTGITLAAHSQPATEIAGRWVPGAGSYEPLGAFGRGFG